MISKGRVRDFKLCYSEKRVEIIHSGFFGVWARDILLLVIVFLEPERTCKNNHSKLLLGGYQNRKICILYNLCEFLEVFKLTFKTVRCLKYCAEKEF